MKYINSLFETTPSVFRNFDKETPELTPVYRVNDYWVKRDDLYQVFDVVGAKARQAYGIISKSDKDTVVTAGSRFSPQIQIVANICKNLNKKCRCHTIRGKDTEELKIAIGDGAQIIHHEDTWHNSVIIARAKKDAEENNCLNVPFGMESWESIYQTALQTKNLPKEVKHIVITAGSGMNLCGVLWGLILTNRTDVKVTGVSVGYNVQKTLKKYAPLNIKNLTVVKSELGYEDKVFEKVGDIELDPIYESKCVPYLEPNCLFWIIGKRR